MKIHIVSGKGTGSTLLSAFDTALSDTGVLNYNLIYLSSIIPPGSEVVKLDKFQPKTDSFGNRLYVVHAEKRSDHVGKYIGAGLGWMQFEDGRGLFVEHTIEANSEKEVNSFLQEQIESSLSDLCKNRDLSFALKAVKKIEAISKIEKPTCVLVFAVYMQESW